MATYNITVDTSNIGELKNSETFKMGPVVWKDDTSAGTDEFINDLKIIFKNAVNGTTDVDKDDKESVILQMNKINAGNVRSEYIDKYGWLKYEFIR